MDIKNFLINLKYEQKYRYCRTLKEQYPEKIKLIVEKTKFLNNTVKLKERIYCILNGIYYKKLCPICDRPVKFKKTGQQYNDHCSTSCSQKDKNVKEKYKKTFQKKYGIEVDCNFKLPNYYSDMKNNLKRKYGVENISQLNYVKEKKRKTFQKNNNKLHPNWGNTWYEITCPNNKKVKVQGYERFAAPIIFKKYDENDILISNLDIKDKIGDIVYRKNNKLYRYYPDFYIISENKIIEVKSLFTLMNHIDDVKLKFYACRNNGFDFEFWIMNYKGLIINDEQKVKKILKRIYT